VAYKYRGAKFEDDEPEITNGCGTYSGYRAHLRKEEQACQDCKDAANAYWRNHYQERKAKPKRVYEFSPDACGTNAGYARHKRYNIPPCDACRQATAQYVATYRARKAAA